VPRAGATYDATRGSHRTRALPPVGHPTRRARFAGERGDDILSRCSRQRCDFAASSDADNAPPAHLVAPGCEPAVDPFGDCLPSGLKHHVVAHVGKELCFRAVGACCFPYFVLAEDGVRFGSQDK